MESVEVTARFDASGKIHPVSLVYRGQNYPIDSVGRRWQDETGLHILVMPDGFRVWELIYRLEEARWYLRLPPGVPGDPNFA